ncbi:MAG: hypothetical protein ACLQU4_06990 [Limisphaerales bacterium]
MKRIDKTSFWVAALALSVAGGVQAQQTISGWGADNGEVSGVSITDNGGGNFTASGTPTGNADMRADLPTAVTLSAGESLTLSGSLTWSTGSMGGGVFRIGIIDFSSPGTLSSGVWSVGPTATGYWWGLPTGGSGVSNPGGGEITGKPASAGNAWLSGTGGYAVPGTGNNNSADMTPGSYNFSLSLLDQGSSVQIGYSMVKTGSGYTETGTVVDNVATVPLSFNAVGFFANGSDSAFASPGVSFGDISETIAEVPEPSTIALGVMGACSLLLRRRSK